MIRSLIPHHLHDYFNQIYWPKKLGRSPKTASLYKGVIKRLGEFLQRDAVLVDLNDDTLCAFLQWRLASRSPVTASREKEKIVALANFAAKKRHIVEFVDVPAIPIPEKQPVAMTLEQIQSLLSACKLVTGRIGLVRAAEWWYAYHLVNLTIGERTGAMLELRWEWLRPDGTLPVPGIYRKCKKPKTHHLPPVAMQAIENLRGRTEGRIFEFPFHKTTFWLRNKKVLRAAGLPTTREWQPQMNRRTFASWLEANGGDATEALDHSARRVTTKSYLDPTIAIRSKASTIATDAMKLG